MARTPTVELKGPRGTIVVNEIDAKKWLAKGYVAIGEVVSTASSSTVPPPSQTSSDGKKESGDESGSDNVDGDGK